MDPDSSEHFYNFQLEETRTGNQPHPCPNCGYCPHCGRGGVQPMIPAPAPPTPFYPYPYWGTGDAGWMPLGTVTVTC